MRREWRSGRSVGTDARNGAGEWFNMLYNAARRADYHQLSKHERRATAYSGRCVFGLFGQMPFESSGESDGDFTHDGMNNFSLERWVLRRPQDDSSQ
jgi:hypothetical protein